MRIEDIFRLLDGRTLFVGKPSVAPMGIDRLTCSVLKNGEVVQDLELTGEDMPRRTQLQSIEKRVYFTYDNVILREVDVHTAMCELVSGCLAKPETSA